MTDAHQPDTPPRRELRGVVERITYQNAENGYTIARLSPERQGGDSGQTEAARGEDRLVTVVGTLADLTPGEAIVAQGWWQQDHRYGWQFKVLDYRTALPATTQGMRRYLGSGLVKGVGPKMAERIVDAFGDTTFDVIDATPERLTEVPGIGRVRSERIAATWEEQRHIREVMAALQGYGVSTSLAVRIYKRFGDDSARVVAQEPYRLAREVWGIGFKTADQIAQAVGIAPDAPERLQAGVLHAFAGAGDEGHTLLPQAELLTAAAELLGVEQDRLEPSVTSLLETGDLVAATRKDSSEPLLALAPFARAESSLAGRLRALAAASQAARVARTFVGVDWGKVLGWLAERHEIVLAPEQEEAVRMALSSPFSILTGGPGTGKTHTLRAILTLLGAKRLRPLLAAPTGRAAKRMTEATGLPASTLHRTLEIRPGGKPGRGPDSPLAADLVVVDEVSMLDALLANQLVKAVEPGMHLLLVGDPDQLPSVGAGNVLADLLASEQFPVTRLTQIFRQGEGSGIALNARRVNEGQRPRFGPGIEDCYFLPAEDPAEAAELVTDLVARRLPARYGFGPGDVQVLSPMHRGEAGVGVLNQRLQERLNPPREGALELRGGGRTYRIGDRVLQLRNDYDLEVFNGDLGTVRSIDTTEQGLLIGLDDGREVRYPSSSLYALTHAYAVSVHKAQGAEFPAVVIPLVTSHAVLLSRTLLYTALTRARRLVVLVGQRKALFLAVRDWRRTERHTALAGLLTGTLRLSWPRGPASEEDPQHLWEGLTDLTEATGWGRVTHLPVAEGVTTDE
ncbi:MAG: ATP-dependent RecD-like DNA helicase [Chloroflexota bacterium]|nr:ATP-dependent RecD-like DNA helicase [Chloroflexota bacterium]